MPRSELLGALARSQGQAVYHIVGFGRLPLQRARRDANAQGSISRMHGSIVNVVCHLARRAG